MMHLRRLARASPALVFLLLCLCSAQSTPGNTAGSTTNVSRPQAVDQNTIAKAPVIQVQSNLVLVDVVVTRNGVPVKGLTKDQFRVLENGKEQELKVFEVHTEAEQPATANAASTNAPAPRAPALAPNTYSDFTPYPPSSSVSVLLIAHYLSAIPGRKNLIWFSESFPMLIQRGFYEDVRETDRALTAARIAVYPIDARGVFAPESVNDASVGALPARMMQARQRAASEGVYLADQTIQQVAAETGGKAFVNSNRFQEAIQQAFADSANYYTIRIATAITPTARGTGETVELAQ